VAQGGFELWKELRARGHRVMPHGYRHANKAELPLDEAKRLIEACLDAFRAELDGFERRRRASPFATTGRPPSSRPG
jgi:peptidoglycan/xylan/chitin deacetylase (PgdA/CDA1 family)